MDLNLLIANLTQIRDNFDSRGTVDFVSDGEDFLCLLVRPTSGNLLHQIHLEGLTPEITELNFTRTCIELNVKTSS